MNIAFVLEATSTAGGHRNVFSLANHLADRGHDVVIFGVEPDQSQWMNLRVPVISVGSYPALIRRLMDYDGVKIATWWRTARPVAESGGGFYFIQDIETSYSHGNSKYQSEVMESYKLGLTPFTYGIWIQEEFQRLGLGEITRIGMAVVKDTFYASDRTEPSNDVVLFHERDHFLKGPKIRNAVLCDIGREFTTTGYSPWQANPYAVAHLRAPSDEVLAEHMRNAFAMLVTSIHEGFCLPALEAMTCGLPVVTTPADGNMEFCEHQVNCLVGDNPAQLAKHLRTLKEDVKLWRTIREGGLHTAARYNWDDTVSRLEKLLTTKASPT